MVDSLNVNVVGVIYTINAFLSLVRKGSAKKITVISTGIADAEMVVQHDIPGSLVYSSMKAATNMVVAKYAVELKGEEIVVLALSPGVVNTQEGPGKFSIYNSYAGSDGFGSIRRTDELFWGAWAEVSGCLSSVQGPYYCCRECCCPEEGY